MHAALDGVDQDRFCVCRHYRLGLSFALISAFVSAFTLASTLAFEVCIQYSELTGPKLTYRICKADTCLLRTKQDTRRHPVDSHRRLDILNMAVHFIAHPRLDPHSQQHRTGP